MDDEAVFGFVVAAQYAALVKLGGAVAMVNDAMKISIERKEFVIGDRYLRSTPPGFLIFRLSE